MLFPRKRRRQADSSNRSRQFQTAPESLRELPTAPRQLKATGSTTSPKRVSPWKNFRKHLYRGITQKKTKNQSRRPRMQLISPRRKISQWMYLCTREPKKSQWMWWPESDSHWQYWTGCESIWQDVTIFDSTEVLDMIVTVCDRLWHYATVCDSNIIWQDLNSMWQYLTVFDSMCQYLTVFYSIWQYLTGCDSIWQYLTAFDSNC